MVSTVAEKKCESSVLSMSTPEGAACGTEGMALTTAHFPPSFCSEREIQYDFTMRMAALLHCDPGDIAVELNPVSKPSKAQRYPREYGQKSAGNMRKSNKVS